MSDSVGDIIIPLLLLLLLLLLRLATIKENDSARSLAEYCSKGDDAEDEVVVLVLTNCDCDNGEKIVSFFQTC